MYCEILKLVFQCYCYLLIIILNFKELLIFLINVGPKTKQFFSPKII